MEHKRYPSDLTDEQWALLQPLIPPARPGGRPRKTEMCRVLNALFYVARQGCTWRALPHDFPPWKTVYNYFQWFQWDGTWQRLIDTLRERVRCRPAGNRRRAPRPSTASRSRRPRADGRSAPTAARRSMVASDISSWSHADDECLPLRFLLFLGKHRQFIRCVLLQVRL
jgi:putative transposase